MSAQTILMSNIGYARGINGSLAHHLFYAHRHFYCSHGVQEKVLHQVSQLVLTEDPDICCFLEIDQGAAGFNHLEQLLKAKYAFSDIENKYGEASRLRRLPLTRSKSNAFLARRKLHYEKIYFSHGAKRLIYQLTLSPNLTLFFAHFSLKLAVRAEQLKQVGRIIAEMPGEVVFMGDFNIHTGLGELKPLLDDGLILLNRPDIPTFRFHRTHMLLDVCLCSPSLAPRTRLRVVPQPYSDHAALVLKLENASP